jgi:HSP20 family protein
MAIIKWSPFGDLDKFFDNDFVPLMPAFRHAPAIDVYSDENNVYVETSLAGVDPEKVQISIEDNVLILKGETEKKEEVKEKDYYRKEIRRGSFQRSIVLPAEVKADAANAESKDGMLKITIPKAEPAKVKKVEVKISKK